MPKNDADFTDFNRYGAITGCNTHCYKHRYKYFVTQVMLQWPQKIITVFYFLKSLQAVIELLTRRNCYKCGNKAQQGVTGFYNRTIFDKKPSDLGA